MKFKKIALTLVLALFLTCIPTDVVGATDITSAPADMGNASSVLFDESQSVVTEMVPYTVTTGTEADLKKSNFYVLASVLPSDQTSLEAVVPIKVKAKGSLYCGIQTDENANAYYDVEIYADAACTKKVSYYSSEAYIEKAGTYYAKVSISDYSEVKAEGYLIGFGLSLVTGNDKILKNNTWVCSATSNYKSPAYFKVTTSKTSKLTLEYQGEYSAYLTLCNSKKKVISGEEYISTGSDGKISFAVPKGTYYVKITTSSAIFRMKPTIAAASEQTGSSKSKAPSITTNNKAKKGVLLLSDKTSKVDWIKFNNPKSQYVTITVDGSISGDDVKIEFINSKGESFGSSTMWKSYKTSKSFSPYVGSFSSTNGKLPKGTYYIKITKYGKSTNGTYSVKAKPGKK